MQLTPAKTIGLYIHLPWCVKKCPYCDFNSHAVKGELDETGYVDCLINDFESEIKPLFSERHIGSIFFGGGTPSLFSPTAIENILTAIKSRYPIAENAEITMEANPGTADASHFQGYRQAGVNRLSLGCQSFDDGHLQALGRIHSSEQIVNAVIMLKTAGFKNFNLDLMYGLPEQTPEQAKNDIAQALALEPTHLSAYQLTIEPNTLFAYKTPNLPDESTSWQIQNIYHDALRQAGFEQYEVSAFAKPGLQCLHNLNYWRFGDYLGIGAGAHGKITTPDGVYRSVKPKHPAKYQLAYANNVEVVQSKTHKIAAKELPLEYMMNKLRLLESIDAGHFEAATGIEFAQLSGIFSRAVELNLLDKNDDQFRVTQQGKLFLNDLLELFMIDDTQAVTQCCG